MYVYKIECKVNNKCYIGQTKDLHKRKIDHLYKLNKNTHYSKELQKDFNKYGESQFEFIILEEVKVNNSDDCERKWIEILNNNYNIESGGVKNKKLADETKRQLSEKAKKRYKTHSKYINSKESIKKRSISNTGKNRDERFCKKMSEIAKTRIGNKNPFFGKKHSEETKLKISNANKGKYDGGKQKIKVEATNLKTGKITIFESKAEASKNGFPARSLIDKVINGEKESYNGHTFKELR